MALQNIINWCWHPFIPSHSFLEFPYGWAEHTDYGMATVQRFELTHIEDVDDDTEFEYEDSNNSDIWLNYRVYILDYIYMLIFLL